MVKICIVGWYGSETLGDRAILDGIVCVFSERYKSFELNIGSLYPFFTERTIFEDKILWNSHGSTVNSNTFDIYDSKVLHSTISDADWLIMGGGPLMDLTELFIIQHSFRFAKKKGVPTVLMGCGYGPLKKKEFVDCVKNIVNYSDIVIMRSEACANRIKSLTDRVHNHSNISSSVDPAMISAVDYATKHRADESNNKCEKWIINIRDLDYVNATNNCEYFKKIKIVLEDVLDQLPAIQLLANHTFFVGGDDRYVSNAIKMSIKKSNIQVIQRPLTLEEMFRKIIIADGCIGMRYHSIVFQTYLNGNNYIIDYTDKKEGKIISFLNTFDKGSFYKNRYINIEDNDAVLRISSGEKEHFQYDPNEILNSIHFYNSLLDRLQ